MASNDIGIRLALEGVPQVNAGLNQVGSGLRGISSAAESSSATLRTLALSMGMRSRLATPD